MEARGGVSVAAVFTQGTVPEAGAFSAVAARRREPIVWADSTAVGRRTTAALKRAGVKTVRLLGPTSRLSGRVATNLTGDGFRTMRFDGGSSSRVSAQIAEYFRNTYSGDEVVLARTTSGQQSDAVLAAGLGRPVLVVTTTAPGSVTAVMQRNPRGSRVRALGTNRVGSLTLTRVSEA